MTTQTVTRLRFMLSQIVLLAVFVACLLPAGFMPGAQAGDEKFSIVICTSTGMKTIEIDGENHDSAPSEQGCAYAPVLAQDIPLPSPVATHSAKSFTRVHYTALDLAEIAAYRHVYSAQAPPSSFLN
jgi:hypothetical protein